MHTNCHPQEHHHDGEYICRQGGVWDAFHIVAKVGAVGQARCQCIACCRQVCLDRGKVGTNAHNLQLPGHRPSWRPCCARGPLPLSSSRGTPPPTHTHPHTLLHTQLLHPQGTVVATTLRKGASASEAREVLSMGPGQYFGERHLLGASVRPVRLGDIVCCVRCLLGLWAAGEA